MLKPSEWVKAVEKAKKEKPKKICPLTLGRSKAYIYCMEERCAWYDERARICAIQILAWEQ